MKKSDKINAYIKAAADVKYARDLLDKANRELISAKQTMLADDDLVSMMSLTGIRTVDDNLLTVKFDTDGEGCEIFIEKYEETPCVWNIDKDGE